MSGTLRLFPWKTKHLAAQTTERVAVPPIPGQGYRPAPTRARSRCHNCMIPPGGIVEWTDVKGGVITLGPRQRVALEREVAEGDPNEWTCIVLDPMGDEGIECRGHWELRNKYGLLARRSVRRIST